MSALTLALCQRKGGVGRTSLTFNLAGAFAAAGSQVLLIDLDPQASLTKTCLGPEAVAVMPSHRTVAEILEGGSRVDAASLVWDVPEVPGVRILPGSGAVAKISRIDPEKSGRLRLALADAIESIGKARPHDVVLIDTPPTLEALTWIAAAVADAAFTPAPPEPMVAQELADAAKFLERVRWAANPKLLWLGVVLTMHMPRLSIHAAIEQGLREEYGDFIFKKSVPHAAVFKEVAIVRKPIAMYKPSSSAAAAVQAIADEIRERMAFAKNGNANLAGQVSVDPQPQPEPETSPARKTRKGKGDAA